MSRRISMSLVALVVAAMAFTVPAAAQVIVSSSGTGGVFTSHSAGLPISDQVVRAMIATHLPSALQPGSEDNHVVLVIDANDQYVSGKASKAMTNVMGPGSVTVRSTNGDTSVVSSIVIRSTSSGDAPAGAAAGASFFFSRDSTSSGVMGTDVKLADVATMGMKRYAAGELGESLIIVSVVKLK